MSAAFTATYIDISVEPVTEHALPDGWTAELMAAVEAGKISYRRAVKIAAAQ